jgi:hypothetical protein
MKNLTDDEKQQIIESIQIQYQNCFFEFNNPDDSTSELYDSHTAYFYDHINCEIEYSELFDFLPDNVNTDDILADFITPDLLKFISCQMTLYHKLLSVNEIDLNTYPLEIFKNDAIADIFHELFSCQTMPELQKFSDFYELETE